MKCCIIGLGLIGGSISIDLRHKYKSIEILGIDRNEDHCTQALELGLVDTISDLETISFSDIDVVFLAIPVDKIQNVLQAVLSEVSKKTVVIDLGSTKESICEVVKNHKSRKNFVAAHPIAGTENAGPNAAIANLFKGKVNIICEKEKSEEKHLNKALEIFEALEMKTTFMTASEHDKHIAYVSHLSHISSFALGKTVLDTSENEKNIFEMAGSGFASTVRLAKSSPDMWSPIFKDNKKNISASLSKYIEVLTEFKVFIDNDLTSETHRLMEETNEIRRILNGIELK